MSYYYNYFLGYQRNDDGLIYPLGPYDMNGNLHNVFDRSRSFASDLHERFYLVPEDKYSDALKTEFEYTDYTGEKCLGSVRYLPINELPDSNYIKRGYFLLEDVLGYERDGDAWERFYDYIPSEVYAQRMQNELAFGEPKPQVDDFGEEIVVHSCRDYVYYAYPDYYCEGYEVSLLRNALEAYEYGVKELEDSRIVILETEG